MARESVTGTRVAGGSPAQRRAPRWSSLIRGLTGSLVLASLAVGCGLPGTGGEELVPGPSAEEFVAEVDAYLSALAAGDLDTAWGRVCQAGFGASDRETFDRRHADAPRPVTWQLEYVSAGSGTGRGAGPGGGGGTPPGAEVTVELDDGTRGEVRLLYGREGLCQIIGDQPLVDALHPAPTTP